MCFVDGKERNVGLFQQFAKMRLGRAFRRGVEQIEFSGFQASDGLRAIVVGRGKGGGPYPDRLSAAQLVTIVVPLLARAGNW